MRHTHCTRINLKDGSKSFVEFGEIDGMLLSLRWNEGMHKGYKGADALLIVNRWNYIAQLDQRKPQFMYYLHSAEGAD